MHWRRLTALLAMLVACGGSAFAGTATTTTLTVTSSGSPVTSVSAGTEVILTATVKAGGTNVSPGQVLFCNAAGAMCADIHLLKLAQLTSSGTAVYRFYPAPGTHSYKAVFLGTKTYNSSTSSTSSLSVPVPVTASISMVQIGEYQINSTFSAPFAVVPTGTISYVDDSNIGPSGPYALTTGTLSGAGAPFSASPRTGPFAYGGGIVTSGAIAVGDFNEDGKLDLAATDTHTDLAILTGNGDGTFTLGSAYSSQTEPWLAVADFNSDGHDDVVDVGFSQPNGFQVFLGNGDGTLSGLAVTNPAFGGNQIGVRTGDFNNDGIMDVAVLESWINNDPGGNEIFIQLGNGDGTFRSAGYLSIANSLDDAQLLDFDGDGILDVVFASTNLVSFPPVGYVSFAHGNGDGTFRTPVAIQSYNNVFPSSIALGDFNNDGKLDFLLALNSAGAEGLFAGFIPFLGNGNGTFAAQGEVTSNDAVPDLVSTGDFNGDGVADAVATSAGSSVAIWFMGNGDGTFNSPASGSYSSTGGQFVGESSRDFVFADFNGDGYTDIADSEASGQTDYPSVGVYLSTWGATGTYSATVPVPIGTGNHTVRADYNGDSFYPPFISAQTFEMVAEMQTPTLTLSISPPFSSYGQQVSPTVTFNPTEVQNQNYNGETVTFLVNGGPFGTATVEGGSAFLDTTNLPVGTDTIQATYPGDLINFMPANSQILSYVVNPVAWSPPSTPVGQTSATQAVYLTFSQPTTLNPTASLAIVVTSQDDNNILGFLHESGGTCVADTGYAANSSCSVMVAFKPEAVGRSLGAVLLYDDSQELAAAAYISGTGTAPLGVFTEPVSATSVGTFSTPRGINVTPGGTISLSEYSGGSVDEITSGGVVTKYPVSGDPAGTAIDGAGNLWFGVVNQNAIEEIVFGSGSTTPVTVASVPAPDNALVIDTNGNVFAMSSTTDSLMEVEATTHTVTTVLASGSTVALPVGSGTVGRCIGMAIDAYNDIFLADYTNNRLYEVYAGSNTATLIAYNNGVTNYLNQPQGLAIDAAGNLYVTNSGDGSVIEYYDEDFGAFFEPVRLGISGTVGIAVAPDGSLDAMDGNNVTKYSRSTTSTLNFSGTSVPVGSVSTAQDVNYENDGNVALTFSALTGTNASLGGADTNCRTSSSVAVGAVCTFGVEFAPTTVGNPLSGSIGITTNSENVTTSRTIPVTGTATIGTKTITFPQPSTPATAGSTATLTATTSSGDAVTYTVTSGTASISGSTITYTNAGSVTIAANSAANSNYNAAATVSRTVVVDAAASAYRAPSTYVTQSSGTQTAYVNITTTATLATVLVETQGVTGLDFALVSGGSCTMGTAFSAGQVCSVLYSFSPLYPGQKLGAVKLLTSGSTVMGTSYLVGLAAGSLGLFNVPVQTTLSSSLSTPRGVSVDESGNVWVGEQGAAQFDKFTSSGAKTTYTLPAGSTPAGTATDGVGNVFVVSGAPNELYEIASGGSTANAVASLSFAPDNSLLADGAGNLFVMSSTDNSLREIAAGTLAQSTVLPSGTAIPGISGATLGRCIGTAMDAGGNIYLADFTNNRIYMVAPGYYGITVLVNQDGLLDNPHGIAVDAAGDLYVTNYSGASLMIRYQNNRNGTYTGTVLSHFAGDYGAAMGEDGTLYLIDGSYLLKDNRSTSALNFPNTPVGSSSTQKIVGLEDDGDDTLSISSISGTSANVNGSGTTCTSSLNQADTCNLGVEFAPTGTPASVTGSINIVDSTLENSAGTTQTITVTGQSIQASQTITFPQPASPVAYSPGLQETLTATASSGLAVSYSVTSGPATVSGSTLSITGGGTVVVAASQAGNTIYTAATTVSVSVTVSPGPQTITFPQPASPVVYSVGLQDTLTATASSGLAVSYSVTSGPATVSGSTLSITGGGTVVVAASQAGNANYAAAATVSVSIVVTPASQTITFPQPASPVAYSAGLQETLTATASSGLGVSYSITSGPGTVSGSTLSITGVGTVVVAASQAGNASYSAASTVSMSVVITLGTKTITFPLLPTPTETGTAATLSATASNGDPVTYSITAGTANLVGSAIGYTTAGTVTIAADSAATANYSAAPTVSQSVMVIASSNSYAAPATAVGTTSATQTAYVQITTNGTLHTISVLTQGATGLDFNMVSGGTCAYQTAYTSGQACTVLFSFTPAHPWVRLGGISLSDASGNLLGNVFLNGVGTGPQATFSTTPLVPITLGSGFAFPGGIAVDGYGDVIVADTNNHAVKELVAVNGSIPASPTILTLASGLGSVESVAVDGSGNVYVASATSHTITELVAVGGVIPASPTIRALGSSELPFSAPYGVAVDGRGNVYVADAGNNTVKEMGTIDGVIPTNPALSSVGSGYDFPSGVAVDGNGNVYIGDTTNNMVKEVIGGTATKIGSGFSGPRGVAVDGSGNVYVADSSHNAIKEIMAVGGAVPTTGATVTTLGSGFSLPGGVAVDGSGNVYIADTTHSLVKEINVENAPSLSFSSTAVGASSAQQVVTLGNNGNTPLTLDSFSTTANFNLGGAGTTCSNSSTIAAGGSCGLGVVFEPTTVSSLLTGSMPLVDNTLNASSTMQTVVLSGASTLGSKAITFPQPLTPAVMGGSATLTATASNGDPVTYTVVSGTATIAGSAITYTAAGTVTIAADSAATSTYAAATEVTATVTVSADSLTWLPSMLSIYAGAAIGADVFDASSNEPGTITYTSTLLPSGAPVAATAATVLTAGSYDLTATVAPTLPSYQSLQSTQVFTVQNMNAFVANSSGSMASLFNNGTEQSGAISGGGIGAAVDSEGFVWSIGVDGSSLWKFADTGALAATYTGVGLSGATALAIDGNSNLVVTNGNSVVVLSNAGVPLSTTTDSTISGPTGVAVDDAGNVWVSNGANSTVDEVIGGAGPLAPLAVSVQTGNPGAKP